MLEELEQVLATWSVADINTVHAALLRTHFLPGGDRPSDTAQLYDQAEEHRESLPHDAASVT